MAESNTPTVLTVAQWKLLCRLYPNLWDVFADLVADINEAMEEDRPGLFFPGYAGNGQTLKLSLHVGMCG